MRQPTDNSKIGPRGLASQSCSNRLPRSVSPGENSRSGCPDRHLWPITLGPPTSITSGTAPLRAKLLHILSLLQFPHDYAGITLPPRSAHQLAVTPSPFGWTITGFRSTHRMKDPASRSWPSRCSTSATAFTSAGGAPRKTAQQSAAFEPIQPAHRSQRDRGRAGEGECPEAAPPARHQDRRGARVPNPDHFVRQRSARCRKMTSSQRALRPRSKWGGSPRDSHAIAPTRQLIAPIHPAPAQLHQHLPCVRVPRPFPVHKVAQYAHAPAKVWLACTPPLPAMAFKAKATSVMETLSSRKGQPVILVIVVIATNSQGKRHKDASD